MESSASQSSCYRVTAPSVDIEANVDDAVTVLRAALVHLLGWSDTENANARELSKMAKALADKNKREFLSWLGSALVKAQSVNYVYLSFPELSVGALHIRKQVLPPPPLTPKLTICVAVSVRDT